MKKIFLCLSVLLIVAVYTSAQTMLKENITCKQAETLIQEHRPDTDFVILDVRTPEEFRNGHLEKAVIIDFKSADFKEE
ncbi:MAG: rhodanese-like domain-containing protein, partial [Bacteroidales bacterium]